LSWWSEGAGEPSWSWAPSSWLWWPRWSSARRSSLAARWWGAICRGRANAGAVLALVVRQSRRDRCRDDHYDHGRDHPRIPGRRLVRRRRWLTGSPRLVRWWGWWRGWRGIAARRRRRVIAHGPALSLLSPRRESLRRRRRQVSVVPVAAALKPQNWGVPSLQDTADACAPEMWPARPVFPRMGRQGRVSLAPWSSRSR
jgi:hypothetical protein